jgi:hypothetical protein
MGDDEIEAALVSGVSVFSKEVLHRPTYILLISLLY